jgi:hypothetical protein
VSRPRKQKNWIANPNPSRQINRTHHWCPRSSRTPSRVLAREAANPSRTTAPTDPPVPGRNDSSHREETTELRLPVGKSRQGTADPGEICRNSGGDKGERRTWGDGKRRGVRAEGGGSDEGCRNY